MDNTIYYTINEEGLYAVCKVDDKEVSSYNYCFNTLLELINNGGDICEEIFGKECYTCGFERI